METTLANIPADKVYKARILLRPVRRTTPEFRELVESIKADHILQPILVRPSRLPTKKGMYEVVEGNHRYVAGKEVGLSYYPCQIRDLTDEQVMVIQLKANAIRPKETSRYEYAKRLRKLADGGKSIGELSAMLDKRPSWIRNTLKLYNLVPAAAEALNMGLIPLTSADALANLPPELQENFVEDAKIMSARDFVDRAKTARAEYDAFLLGEQDRLYTKGCSLMRRPIEQIMQEAIDLKQSTAVLRAVNAVSPRDGWQACLAWIYQVDPESIARRQNRKAHIDRKKFSRYEARTLKRQMLNSLLGIDVQGPGGANEVERQSESET